jgi:hypothetical protein
MEVRPSQECCHRFRVASSGRAVQDENGHQYGSRAVSGCRANAYGFARRASTRVDYVNSLQENLKEQDAASEQVRDELKALLEQTALTDPLKKTTKGLCGLDIAFVATDNLGAASF